MKTFLQFIQYHNLSLVFFGVLFVGGSLFAYNDGLEVLSSNQVNGEEVVIDTALIQNVDLDNFSFDVRVLEVVENDSGFVVTYAYETIALVAGVWEETTVEKMMTVDTASLVGTDILSYLHDKLQQVEESERVYLARVQQTERQQVAESQSRRDLSGLSLSDLASLSSKELVLPKEAKVKEEEIAPEIPLDGEEVVTEEVIEPVVEVEIETETEVGIEEAGVVEDEGVEEVPVEEGLEDRGDEDTQVDTNEEVDDNEANETLSKEAKEDTEQTEALENDAVPAESASEIIN